MKVGKLLHTRMRVSDMEQTVTFYTEVLGLEVLERKTSPRGSHLAFLKVPDSEELIELCSFPASGAVQVQEDLVHLAFEVEDMDHTARTVPAKTNRTMRDVDSVRSDNDCAWEPLYQLDLITVRSVNKNKSTA